MDFVSEFDACVVLCNIEDDDTLLLIDDVDEETCCEDDCANFRLHLD